MSEHDEISEVSDVTETVVQADSPQNYHRHVFLAVTLIPQEGVLGRGGYATSGVDGTFALQAEPEAIGVAAGTYRVLLQKYAMPDGSPVPPGTSAADANLINQLPVLYSYPERSPLSVTIPSADGQAFLFKMSSNLRQSF